MRNKRRLECTRDAKYPCERSFETHCDPWNGYIAQNTRSFLFLVRCHDSSLTGPRIQQYPFLLQLNNYLLLKTFVHGKLSSSRLYLENVIPRLLGKRSRRVSRRPLRGTCGHMSAGPCNSFVEFGNSQIYTCRNVSQIAFKLSSMGIISIFFLIIFEFTMFFESQDISIELSGLEICGFPWLPYWHSTNFHQ